MMAYNVAIITFINETTIEWARTFNTIATSLFLMRIQDILWIWLFALFMIQVCIFQVYS